MTNHERIKNMSVEEMAEFIRDTNCSHCSGNCLSGTPYKGGCTQGIRNGSNQKTKLHKSALVGVKTVGTKAKCKGIFKFRKIG